MIDVLCLGELLVDFVSLNSGHRINEGPDFHPAAGGAPANAAAGLGRLGSRAAFSGRVGNDSFGVFLRRALEENNVDTRWLWDDKRANTTLAFVSLDASGERDFEFYRNPGADTCLTVEDVDQLPWEESKVFHFGSVSLSKEPARTATQKAAQVAFEKGLVCSFDPNFRPPLWDSWNEALPIIQGVMHWAHVVKVNEEEFALLAGTSDPETGSAKLFAEYPHLQLLLLTLGSAGAQAFTRSIQVKVPAFPAVVKDTTGAGDAFVAGFWHGIISEDLVDRINDLPVEPLRSCLETASAAAAWSVERYGAIPSLPNKDQLRSVLERP